MSSSSTFPQWKHDVFVSFGKDDVIKTFISSLFERLNQVGINYFEDDNREGAGQKNAAERLKAICQQTFAFALVVFSENYVNSSPCLDELVEILNCKRVPELVVIPIFYIDRAKVSEAASNGAFKQALGRVKEEEKRRSALANGLAIGSSERNLIDKIVGRLVNEIYHSRNSGNDFIFGPFGSKGGNDWESVDIMGIAKKGIAVEYGEFIESVTFEVDEQTPFIPQNDGKSTFKVKLEDGEYITSFAGSKNANNRGIINSLTFRTNKRILGPIGRVEEEEEEKTDKKDETDKKKKEEEEEYFSVPSDAGEVIKFFWRKEGNFLESVGAQVGLHCKGFNPFRSVGLFGKKKGQESRQEWDDKHKHANVRKIIVHIGQIGERDSSGTQFIRCIEFHYKDKDEMKRHGSNTGGEGKTITIDGRDEYLTSISGYYTDFGITSLTFRTNKRMAIPIGEEKGIYFSSPATAGKIVGFYGYNEGHLCGIGAYFEPVESITPIGGGYLWDDENFDGVREIHPFVNPDTNYIHGIKFVYDDRSVEGCAVTHGKCTKGDSPVGKPVHLDYPREFLTSISGYMQKGGSISSLTFYSNKQRFTYGEEGGKYFWYPLTGSRIIGFYGIWRKTFNFIGVYVEPIPHLYPFKTVGRPIKGSGGTPWDDGVHNNVRGFRVTVDERSGIIESITFMYDDNGSLVEGSPHGGGDASSGEWEMLDFPEERLTRIEGYYMRVDGDAGQTIIRDLIIVTTKQTETSERYAPPSRSDENPRSPFVIPKESKDGRIVGFFGMAGTHLNSIGARLEPC